MHGLGNDFVIIDARRQRVAMTTERASAIADRKYGIGCDQLILLEPSACADFAMRIFNHDGSEVEACGNAARCVVKLVGGDPRIQTKGGIISGNVAGNNVSVDMGKPQFAWDAIPLAFAMDTLQIPVGWEDLNNPCAVNVGNPHIVFFVADADQVDLARLGPIIEHDPLFPQKINVNVASIHSSGINLHVWERGVGLTRACGTGACATAILAIKRGLVATPVAVHLPGGQLTIDWCEGQSIIMTGEAVEVFSGEADWDSFG
jgi:diaminopimelate epimerase